MKYVINFTFIQIKCCCNVSVSKTSDVPKAEVPVVTVVMLQFVSVYIGPLTTVISMPLPVPVVRVVDAPAACSVQ